MSPTGSNNLIIALVCGGDSRTVTSVTDNAVQGGNQYIKVTSGRATNAGGAEWSDVWYALNSKQKATSITLLISGTATSLDIFIFEVSGMHMISPLQVGLVSDGGATTTPTGGSVTTIKSPEFIASIVRTQGDISAIHAGNEFTLGDLENGDATAYLITNVAAAHAPQFDSTSAAFCSSTVGFRDAPDSIDVRGITSKRKIRSDFYKG